MLVATDKHRVAGDCGRTKNGLGKIKLVNDFNTIRLNFSDAGLTILREEEKMVADADRSGPKSALNFFAFRDAGLPLAFSRLRIKCVQDSISLNGQNLICTNDQAGCICPKSRRS